MIEMLVVLAIAATVTTMAVFSLGNSRGELHRQNLARQFKVSFERARFDSIKRRAANTADMAHIIINSSGSFTLATDLNRNGTIEPADLRRIDFAGGNVRIVGENLVFPITVRFDRRGFATATNNLGTEIAPNFTVCEDCTLLTANSNNSHVVSVSPTGTVSIMTGGESPPILQNPDLSAVSGGSQINPLVTFDQAP